ncbi:MAG: hypothetical protein ACKKL5_00550 [Candidatus Komeilibacteria bacterium]
MLSDNIKKTVVYFDLFAYPLTSWEIWQWLWHDKNGGCKQDDWSEIKQVLDTLVAGQELGSKNGFYFLPGRQELVQLRQQRYRLAQRKYRLAQRATCWLRWLPFIKYIGVCNTLAYNNARVGSDIDLFIVTRQGRIWSARWWSAILMQLLGWRPNKRTAQDKICLSFFVTEHSLDLRDVRVKHDIYLYYWVAQLVPLYDPHNIQTQIDIVNRPWVSKNLPHYISVATPPPRLVQDWWVNRLGRLIFSTLASLIPEFLLKSIQKIILPLNLRQLLNHGTSVIMNDQMLKFHDTDKREQYRDDWQKAWQTIL